MRARIFVILFIACNSFANFVSGQINVLGTTQSHLDAKVLRERYSKPTPPISTYTPPKNNKSSNSGSPTVTKNTEFLPSAEAQKAIDDAITQYDENIKMASACVCNTPAYAEVKFIYSTPVYQKKYGLYERSQELFDMADQLNNNVTLLSGYLLNIKDAAKQVVVVLSRSGNGIGEVWRPYSIKWDKYNSGIPWDLEINIDISGTGNYATLTDKLKYIEKAIPGEQERKIAEQKRNYDAAKKKVEDNEIERKSQITNIKHLGPYNEIGVGTLDGFKLDIKNYQLGPDEEFVAFFVSKAGFAVSQTIYDGNIYKITFKKNYGNSYTVDPVLGYGGIIPADLITELANDPIKYKILDSIKYKILERMVNLKLGLIGTYESDKLEQAEKKYFQETISRMENGKMKKAGDLRKAAEEKSKFGVKTITSLIFTGNFNEEKMNGIGCISSGGNSYNSGLFTNNSKVCGVSKFGGIKTIFLFNTGLSSPMPLIIYEDGKKGVNDYKYAESHFGEEMKFIYNYETLFFNNGEIYYGDNLKSRHAFGTKYFPNGDVYEGYFTDSIFNDHGTYFDASGKVYTGGFNFGVKYGTGTESDNMEGKVFKYENGKRGKKLQSVGPDYREYKHDNNIERTSLSSGITSFEFSTGESVYGAHHGNPSFFRATIRLKNGQVIFGDFHIQNYYQTIEKFFSEDDSSAIRFISYPNQDFYYGKMSNVFSKKGMGAYCYANGEVYIGNFSNDQRNDKEGMIIYPNGNVLRAIFVNDKIEGPGEYLDVVKKEKYLGNFKDGLRDGEGTLYFADGTSKKMIYKDGVLQQ